MFLPTFSSCWKDCGNPSLFIHIWWSCPLVFNFWKRVFTFLSKISKITIGCNPATALLLLHNKSWASSHTPVIVHGIIAARRAITSAWKQSPPPDWSLFIQYLNTQTQLELMLVIKNGKHANFWKQWHHWLTHPNCTASI